MKTFLLLVHALPIASILAVDDTAALREKVAALERRLADLEKKETSTDELAKLREQNKHAARKRAAEDRTVYKPEQLAEIESLYQVANKNWRTDEARTNLKQLLVGDAAETLFSHGHDIMAGCPQKLQATSPNILVQFELHAT